MAAELASLRETASYAIPQGSLRVRHTSSRAELLWLSEGELVRAPGTAADFQVADWRTLQDLMHAQRGEIAHARDMLTWIACIGKARRTRTTFARCRPLFKN